MWRGCQADREDRSSWLDSRVRERAEPSWTHFPVSRSIRIRSTGDPTLWNIPDTKSYLDGCQYLPLCVCVSVVEVAKFRPPQMETFISPVNSSPIKPPRSQCQWDRRWGRPLLIVCTSQLDYQTNVLYLFRNPCCCLIQGKQPQRRLRGLIRRQ